MRIDPVAVDLEAERPDHPRGPAQITPGDHTPSPSFLDRRPPIAVILNKDDLDHPPPARTFSAVESPFCLGISHFGAASRGNNDDGHRYHCHELFTLRSLAVHLW